MADVTLVQGDTGPPLSGALKQPNQQAYDLTDALAVRFQMRQENDRRYTVDAEATIVDADAGTVLYEWGANDLAVAGEYVCQFEIEFADMTVTTDPLNTITVRRQ